MLFTEAPMHQRWIANNVDDNYLLVASHVDETNNHEYTDFTWFLHKDTPGSEEDNQEMVMVNPIGFQ